MIVLEHVSLLAKRYHIPEDELKKILDSEKVLIHRIGRSVDNLMVKVPDAEDAVLRHATSICGPEHYFATQGLENVMDLSEYKQALELLSGISKKRIKHSLLTSLGKAIGDYEAELWLFSGGPLFYFQKGKNTFVVSDLFAFINHLPEDMQSYIKNIFEKEVSQFFTMLRRPIVILKEDCIIVRFFRETTVREKWFVKDLVYHLMYDYLSSEIKEGYKNTTEIED